MINNLAFSLTHSHSLTHCFPPFLSGPDRPIVTLGSRCYLIQGYGEQLNSLECSIQSSANLAEPEGQATMRWEGPRGAEVRESGVPELELGLGQFESELTGVYLCSAANVHGNGGPVEVYIHSK